MPRDPQKALYWVAYLLGYALTCAALVTAGLVVIASLTTLLRSLLSV